MPVLEQVRGIIKALQKSIKVLQTFIMILLAKILSNVSLKTSTIQKLCKRLVLDIWRVQDVPLQNDRYITVLEIQTKICKDGRQVKMESF